MREAPGPSSAVAKPPPTGIPPWHAQVLTGSVAAVAAYFLPSKESLDFLATVETFRNRLFPDLISVKTLGILRLAIATCCWYVLLRMIFIENGWTLYTNFRPQSKLKNSYITLRRLKTMYPFTSWAYCLLALSFSFSGLIALGDGELGLLHDIVNQAWFLRIAIILWEISGPWTLLVSIVVRYAIWPIVLKGGKPHTLDNFRNQMMHNVNSVFALTELALLGGLPLSFEHMSLSCSIGVIYVLFSWSACWSHSSKPEQDGPLYIYFFMDTTLGKNTTIALFLLLSVMTLSFGIFVVLENIISWIGGSIIVNIMIVAFISSLVVRTH